MEHFNNEYALAGFFSASTISFLHVQDIIMALVLGFFGGAGGYIFKVVRTYIEKRSNERPQENKG